MQTIPAPSAIAVWAQAARVKSFAISTIGVLAGAAVAAHDHSFSWLLLIAWLGSVAIQAGTNLVNVSLNYKGGGPGIATDAKSSSAVVHAGLIQREEVRSGGLWCFAVGIACGLVLTWQCGWNILAIGIPAVIAGYSYAGPPLRMGQKGLGVITVLIFMGPVMVCGAYYVAARQFSTGALAASIPVGLLACGIMHVNDVRDYESDIRHGKRTLSTLSGRVGASHISLGIVLLSYLSIGVAVMEHWLPWPVLLVFATIPLAITAVRLIYRENSPDALHHAWLGGVKLHTAFGVLLTAALLGSAALRI